MSYQKVVKNLSEKIPVDIVDINLLRKRGTPPTQAFSDFISHNEQGFWAENLFYTCLDNLAPKYIPVKYGRSDKIIAGDEGFKDFYNLYQDELNAIGKRPDILLFTNDNYKKINVRDISSLSSSELDKIVKQAIAGFEVRSSAYLTKKFVAKVGRDSLSFTPKVEDLLTILKWVSIYGVPHFYVQVFFDSIYILPFIEILIILSTSTLKQKGIKNKKLVGYLNNKISYVIEKNPKNQFKETIHIPLSRGILLSDTVNEPTVVGNRKELSGGRLLHHVSFQGGAAQIDKRLLVSLISKDY